MPDRKPPAEHPAVRRPDRAGADTLTLVDMGLADPPPRPSTPPPPGPSPREQANEALLQDALVEAGVTTSGRDEQVIDALAKLDVTEVEAVTRWLRETRPEEPPPEEPPPVPR
jgi:predicted component of type VI protein secretion system